MQFSVWEESLDYLADGTTTINDFFDLIEEKKSEYGLWLFESVNIPTGRNISFQEYCHVVFYTCMLEKLDMLQLMRANGSKKKEHLTRDDWLNILNVMLSHEKIQYAKKVAITSFKSFASRDLVGNHVLYFEDYLKVSKQPN